jgi:hypothetical protein
MKKKTVNAVICKKMDEWMDSIEDKKLKDKVLKNTIVSGGCITSMLLNEKVNDFDVYFRNEETAFLVAEYYSNKFNRIETKTNPIKCVLNEDGRVKIIVQSAGVAKAKASKNDKYRYFEQIEDTDNQEMSVTSYIGDVMDIAETVEEETVAKKFTPVFVSGNAIMLSGKVQLIFRFFGEADEIHENYDFVHVTNYWTSWDRKLHLNQDALECILARQLRYKNSKYPICAVIRTRKFIKRGWSISAGEYLKMLYQVSKLDLDDIDVLGDQLIGVDSAYFDQIITILRKANEENKDFNLSFSYIAELIDKIF